MAARKKAQGAKSKKTKSNKKSAPKLKKLERENRELQLEVQNNTLRNIKASYKGAISTRTSTGWGSSTSINGVRPLRNATLRAMRDRSRQLERDNTFASAMLDRCVENIIGTGFVPQATTTDAEWNKLADAYMVDWLDHADADGRPWVEHLSLLQRSKLRDGDVGTLLIDDGTSQIIEGDYIGQPYAAEISNSNLVDGIEFNAKRKVVRYYVDSVDRDNAQTWAAIKAEDFVFLKRSKRASGVRGEPVFAQSFDLYDQIDGWVEAQLIAARMAACLGLVITKASPNSAIKNLPYGQNSQGENQKEITFEPGMSLYLSPGETATTLAPSQPQNNFPETLVTMLRLAGIGMGLPIELALMDFSRTNFASSRASLLQAHRSFEAEQEYLTAVYLKRLYQWRISKAIKDGELPEPKGGAQPWAHRWIAPTWPYLNPVQEVLAKLLELDGNLTTLTALHAEAGTDFDDHVAKRGAEIAKLIAAGIPQLHTTTVAEFSQPQPVATTSDLVAETAEPVVAITPNDAQGEME